MNVEFNGRISCVNCGETAGLILQSYTEPDIYERSVGIDSNGYWRHWVKCESCSLLRSEFSRDSKILHTIYEQQYRSVESGLRQQSVEDLFLKISNIPSDQSETHFRVEWLMNALNILNKSGMSSTESSGMLLDVGGASGVFAHAMKQRGFESDIIDPSVDGGFITKYGIGYHQGYFGAETITKQYDLISFLYVLEHLDDPGSILKVVKANLKLDGLLFFEIPDASVVAFCKEDHDAYNSCHLWLFGSAQVTALLQRQGFSVLALQRYITVRGYPSMMVLAGHADRYDPYQ